MKNGRSGAGVSPLQGGEGRPGPRGGEGGAGGEPRPGFSGNAEVFSFAINDGKVTEASRTTIQGEVVKISDNADGRYVVQGSDVVLTRTGAHGQEIIVFSDEDADTLFAVASRARITTEAPRTDSDGQVRAHQLQVTLDESTSDIIEVSRLKRDGSSVVIDNDELSFSINQGLLIETRTSESGLTRWEIFRDGNGDGVYTEVAQGAGDLVDLTLVASLTEPNIDLL